MSQVEVEQIRYKKPIKVIQGILRILELTQITDIFVYPDFPYGYHAVVAVKEAPQDCNVYVFTVRGPFYTEINYRITECLGFRKNGTMIYT